SFAWKSGNASFFFQNLQSFPYRRSAYLIDITQLTFSRQWRIIWFLLIIFQDMLPKAHIQKLPLLCLFHIVSAFSFLEIRQYLPCNMMRYISLCIHKVIISFPS